MASPSGQWTLLLSLTALLLSLAVLAQIASRYVAGYFAAPREVAALVDAVDSSVAENESLDADVAKVPRLEDKLRLGRLLREIQKLGDDLREGLSGLLVGEDDDRPRLRIRTRIMWPARRAALEERLRRLDLLRMRFLVIYMGIVAGKAAEAAAKQQRPPMPSSRDPEKADTPDSPGSPSPPGHLPAALADGIRAKPPLRRITTPAVGHQDDVETPHRAGWAGVVRELQRSPLLHKRHASVESAART